MVYSKFLEKKAFFVFLLFCLGFSGSVFAGVLDCSVQAGSSCSVGSRLFGVLNPSSGYSDVNGNLISSNVCTDNSYPYSICCKSQVGSLNFSIVDSSANCANTEKEVMYFTGVTNSRVAYPFSLSGLYSKKLCLGLTNEFSMMDLKINDTFNYGSLGYTCLYKTNAEVNGLVSACNATFLVSSQYKYTVWVKLVENLDSMKCNSDCTSKLDNRVYSACGLKLSVCSAVPNVCDGSLVGSWVKYNSTHEVRCSEPWNVYRETNVGEKIKIESLTGKCENLIIKKFPVIYNNQVVNMNFVSCYNK